MQAEPPLFKNLAFYAYSLVLAAGVAMYLAWGLRYNSWNILEPQNMGVYSIVVLLVGFGLVGMLIYSNRSRRT